MCFEELNARAVPNTVNFVMDQEACQRSAFYDMVYYLGLVASAVPDLHHRAWNDMLLAMRDSGLGPAFYNAITTYNLAYGPWHKSMYHKLLIDSMLDLCGLMTPDDPLLVFMFPFILLGHGIVDPSEEQCNYEARKEFLANMVKEKSFNIKGPKAAKSRWFPFYHAFLCWDKQHHTKLLAPCTLR